MTDADRAREFVAQFPCECPADYRGYKAMPDASVFVERHNVWCPRSLDYVGRRFFVRCDSTS